MRITRTRAKRLREKVQADRCAQRPSIVHDWRYAGYMTEAYFDYTRGAPIVPQMICSKCRQFDPD